MTSAELKKQSKALLNKRWGNATVATFLFVGLIQIVTVVLSILLVNAPVVEGIINFVLSLGSVYLVLCFVKYCKNVKDTKENVKVSECLVSGKQFLRSILISIILIVVLAVVGIIAVGAGCLLIVPSVVSRAFAVIVIIAVTLLFVAIEVLSFSLTYIIVLKAEYTVKQVIKASMKVGWQNSGQIVYMILSFIGWNVLSVLSCGIGYLWTMPYMELTYVSFVEEKLNEVE